MKLISILIAATAPLAFAFAPAPAFTSSRVSTELGAVIQFVKGLDEKDVPAVKLTRSKDGSSGIAKFQFNNPNCFDASTKAAGEVTGMFMIDEEGELSTSSVNARFANGKPQDIESTYVMTSADEWDRFMRFMERYGEANGLGFNKA
jgi:photosystem II protein